MEQQANDFAKEKERLIASHTDEVTALKADHEKSLQACNQKWTSRFLLIQAEFTELKKFHATFTPFYKTQVAKLEAENKVIKDSQFLAFNKLEEKLRNLTASVQSLTT